MKDQTNGNKPRYAFVGHSAGKCGCRCFFCQIEFEKVFEIWLMDLASIKCHYCTRCTRFTIVTFLSNSERGGSHKTWTWIKISFDKGFIFNKGRKTNNAQMDNKRACPRQGKNEQRKLLVKRTRKSKSE